MYASKRRQRTNFKRPQKSKDYSALASSSSGVPVSFASNPSKRHRERLNGELDNVAALLPFEQSVITKLDKLSVLRLAVSYLETKQHFQVLQQRRNCLQYFNQQQYPFSQQSHLLYPSQQANFYSSAGYRGGLFDFDISEDEILKSLHGFILVINENGEIFYVSSNIEKFLGFHQSDIVHQPIYELVHSEDRQELRHQLAWNYSAFLTNAFYQQQSSLWCQELLMPDLDRNFTVRFRCLLDNTCGFLRLDIKGRLNFMCGLPHCYLVSRVDPPTSVPVLGLFAVCCPFVPPVLGAEISSLSAAAAAANSGGNDSCDEHISYQLVKTKHALDMGILSVSDTKGRLLFDVNDKDLPGASFYKRVHGADLAFVSACHKEVIKTGVAGFLVYRLLLSAGLHSRRLASVACVERSTLLRYIWVQSSARLYYKNSRPESITVATRLLTELEGRNLLEKRISLQAKLACFDEGLLHHSAQPALASQSTPITSSAPSASSVGAKHQQSSLIGSKSAPTTSTTKAPPTTRGTFGSRPKPRASSKQPKAATAAASKQVVFNSLTAVAAAAASFPRSSQQYADVQVQQQHLNYCPQQADGQSEQQALSTAWLASYQPPPPSSYQAASYTSESLMQYYARGLALPTAATPAIAPPPPLVPFNSATAVTFDYLSSPAQSSSVDYPGSCIRSTFVDASSSYAYPTQYGGHAEAFPTRRSSFPSKADWTTSSRAMKLEPSDYLLGAGQTSAIDASTGLLFGAKMSDGAILPMAEVTHTLLG